MLSFFTIMKNKTRKQQRKPFDFIAFSRHFLSSLLSLAAKFLKTIIHIHCFQLISSISLLNLFQSCLYINESNRRKQQNFGRQLQGDATCLMDWADQIWGFWGRESRNFLEAARAKGIPTSLSGSVFYSTWEVDSHHLKEMQMRQSPHGKANFRLE